MKNLQTATALAILKNLEQMINRGVPLGPQDVHDVNDATDHADTQVSVAAFGIIESLPNKTPYETTLIHHSTRHNDPVRASRAFRAMKGAYDLNPFVPALTFGTNARVNQLIAYQAAAIIRHEAEMYNTLPKNLYAAVLNTLTHPSISVAVEGMRALEALNDIGPYIPTLNHIAATQFGVLRSRVNTLLNQHNQKGAMQPAPAPQANNDTMPQCVLDKVLLDFNIAQNDVGPDLHIHDAVHRLSEMFQNSAKTDGVIHSKARVFYDPTATLEDNSIIDVTLPAESADDVLRAALRFESLAFTLKGAEGSTFTAVPAPARELL